MNRAKQLLFSLILAQSAACKQKAAQSGVLADSIAPACELSSDQDWQSWVHAQAQGARQHIVVFNPSDLGEIGTPSQRALQALDSEASRPLGTLAACAAVIAARPKLAACTSRLQHYLQARRAFMTNGFGFRQDNETYLRAQDGPAAPVGMMALPQGLAAALPDGIEALAQTNGWKTLWTYSGINNRYRLFLMVPSARFDQWYFFNAGYTRRVEAEDLVGQIVVQKQDAAGAALVRPRIHFRPFVSRRNEEHKDHLVVDVGRAMSDKCFACHPSGPRQLIASASFPPYTDNRVAGEQGTALEVGAKRLRELNALLKAYQPIDWNGTMTPADLGPALGEKAGCTGCHDDGNLRAPLRVLNLTEHLRDRVQSEFAMPPQSPADLRLVKAELGQKLSAAEQQRVSVLRAQAGATFSTLQGSAGDELSAWLEEAPCVEGWVPPPATPAPPTAPTTSNTPVEPPGRPDGGGGRYAPGPPLDDGMP